MLIGDVLSGGKGNMYVRWRRMLMNMICLRYGRYT